MADRCGNWVRRRNSIRVRSPIPPRYWYESDRAWFISFCHRLSWTVGSFFDFFSRSLSVSQLARLCLCGGCFLFVIFLSPDCFVDCQFLLRPPFSCAGTSQLVGLFGICFLVANSFRVIVLASYCVVMTNSINFKLWIGWYVSSTVVEANWFFY